MAEQYRNLATTRLQQMSSIDPFEVHIAEEELEMLQQLLELTPIAAPTYENSLPRDDRKYGVRHDWLSMAKNLWEKSFDWYGA